MTDTQKKVGLGAVVVIALGIVIWQATALFGNPTHVDGVAHSGFSPGHTMKTEMMAHDAKQLAHDPKQP